MKTPANKTVWLGTNEIALRYGLDRETIRQWILRGVQTPQGVLRLRGLQIGRRWLIKRRWLRDFNEALEAAQGTPTPAPPVEPADKQQERFAAEKKRLQERLGKRKQS